MPALDSFSQRAQGFNIAAQLISTLLT